LIPLASANLATDTSTLSRSSSDSAMRAMRCPRLQKPLPRKNLSRGNRQNNSVDI
jgi:hypothetical protein